MTEVNGIQLFHRDVGYGKPVILLHGYGQNNYIFEDLERHLILKHRVILIDSRGHGQSENGREPFSIALMASDVAALMDAIQLERAAIIGYSDGGNIALQMAADFPDHVASIVSISGNARPGGLKRFYLSLFSVWKQLLTVFRFDTDMMRLLLEQPQMTDAALGGITAPTLLIYGSHDIITQTHIHELHSVIPGSILKIIRNAGHFNIVSKWREYAEEMDRIIS